MEILRNAVLYLETKEDGLIPLKSSPTVTDFDETYEAEETEEQHD
ncbi:hypothetical protein ACSLGG_30535 (plasmid) [Bacillus mycoides]